MGKICRKLLALVLLVSLCACAANTPAGPSSQENSSPSSRSQAPFSQPEPEPEPEPGPQDIADDESEADRDVVDTADGEEDPGPEGPPEIWMGTFDDLSPEEQMMHWSEEEITRLMTEIAAQLYLEDKALIGLTPVFRESSENDVEYSYGIHIRGVPTGYFAYQNDTGEDVAFRAITCSVTWVESERKYLLDLISVEDWKQE